MWLEGFDRGLYQFFIRYIFTPVAAPSYSLPRKIVGMLTSYAFVLVWHGLYRSDPPPAVEAMQSVPSPPGTTSFGPF